MADYKVFISYAPGDELAARELRANLGDLDVTGCMDEADIAAGNAITKKLRKALQEASAMVILVSERSLESPWVQFEFGAAEGMGKPIIPVLIGPKGIEKRLPVWLQGLRIVDAQTRPFRKVALDVSHVLADGVEPARG